LHFGVSGFARGFVIEKIARNTCNTSVDACGSSSASRYVLSKSDPMQRPTRLPADDIARALKALDVPVTLSEDAGTYLCNAVFYHAVTYAGAESSGVMSGFIHMPALYSKYFSKDRAMAGGLEMIRVCLGLSAVRTSARYR
jgi:pyroglutamyl-peptidase